MPSLEWARDSKGALLFGPHSSDVQIPIPEHSQQRVSQVAPFDLDNTPAPGSSWQLTCPS